ncbi:PREDICTED: uncharacterized protein LOC108546766 isoform X1 [Eufriesea mexicana]|uniref:uncharacterized protein LOC108546766 isoform X1 n=1 Tax=Eufriesea mexicana TaxID=516756 RepID=UPI00083BE094|nr:PREDICTED: uncharacterized protein LOC108546766 isoform X1 [Eufriesea mexicana]
MLLGTLPTEFESFCISIESNNDISTIENPKIKRKERNARNTASNEVETSCNKPGHKAKDRRSSRSRRCKMNKREDAMSAVVLNTDVNKHDSWCLDNRATKHMCNNNSISSYHSIKINAMTFTSLPSNT